MAIIAAGVNWGGSEYTCKFSSLYGFSVQAHGWPSVQHMMTVTVLPALPKSLLCALIKIYCSCWLGGVLGGGAV